MRKPKTEKHALVEWRKKWQSDEWYFTSYKDGIEREPLEEKIRVIINLPHEISGYVEESKISWAKTQLLLERQKYLLDGYSKITQGLNEITKLLEQQNAKNICCAKNQL